MDKIEKLFSIGEASKIANVSNKTLRYYEKIGLVVPDKINETNGYRYYTEKNLQNLSIVKYYKQMGYTLTEINDMKNGSRNDFNEIIINFEDKIHELVEKEEELKNSLKSIKDWYKLIKESKLVKIMKFHDINIKFLEKEEYLYRDYEFCYNYRQKILNIDWVKYLETIENEITGAIIFKFDNFIDKLENRKTKMKIIQKPLKEAKKEQLYERPAGMYATIYHIGAFENSNDSYNKIVEWAKKNDIELLKESYERYLTDYWTTSKTEDFVMEILIPIKNC